MNAWRTLVCCGACVFVGCLFPSFDDLKNNDSKEASKGDDDDDAGASSSSSSSASSGGGPSTSSSGGPPTTSSGDGGGVDGGGSEKDIPCNGPCPLPQSFCCTTIGGLSCQGPGTEGFCTSVEGGEIFRCDGEEDCAAGQVCCFANKEAKCVTSCAGQVLCNGPKRTCPAGKSCTGLVESTFKGCQ